MTQEEKQLLLKDLCARLPYGVQVFVEHDEYKQATLLGVDIKQFSIVFGGKNWSSTSNIEGHHVEQYKQIIKPYLRSMSSMTEKEKEEIGELLNASIEIDSDGNVTYFSGNDFTPLSDYQIYIDYLNSHHFDYRGLIEKGLALEAPKDMYK